MPSFSKMLEDDFFDAYNTGRSDEALAQGIEFGVWSSMLDGNVCLFCEWADGKSFRTSDSPALPPAHFGCRCLIVYVTPDMLEEGESVEDEFESWDTPPIEVMPPGTRRKKG